MEDPNIIFFTNNIVESTSRILNSKYRGICKTFAHFEYAILKLIEYFEKKIIK